MADIPHRLRRIILWGALVVTTASVLGTALLPWLFVEHPIALLVLNSDARNLVLVAPRIDLPVVLGLAVPRRALSMLATYGLGLIYGRRMLAWSARKIPRLAGMFDRFEHVYVWLRGPLLLLWPMYITSVLAGVTRARVREFLPWMLSGQLAHGLAIYYLGDALSALSERLLTLAAAHMWEATAVCAGLVLIQRIFAFWRRRRAAPE